jgi:hypothetical protein
MKKIALLGVLLALVLSVTTVSAKVPNGQAGKSNTAHLYLYEKDPSTWNIVEDGAWGKMQYDLSGEEFEFVFNGHGLVAEEEYSLIYYPDPWPGNGMMVLGTAVADVNGNVHMNTSYNTGDLPIGTDTNPGAKIWLVQSGDVDPVTMSMVGWNPTEYLFEYDLIGFNDTSL